MEKAFDILIQKDEITIRRMQDSLHDYQLMAKWLTDEKVLEFYEGRDNPFPLERIIKEYAPTMANDLVVPCIFLDRGLPIGYLQYYLLTEDEKQKYELGESENICGIDLFIGEVEYRNKGIGTQVISTLLNYLFEELQVTKIVVDPEVWNTRAIRCYEKCGFQKVKLLPEHELHEGKYQDSWLMVVEQQKSLN